MFTALLAAIVFSVAPDPNITILAPDAHDETAVAASPRAVVVAVIRRVASPDPAWIEVFVSNDTGVTWSAPIKMPTTIDGIDCGYETDPTLATFEDGSFGLVFLAIKQWPDPRVADHSRPSAECM